MNLSYWTESISEALQDIGLDVTENQLKALVEAVMLTAEMESEYGSPVERYDPAARELEKLKKKIAKNDAWLADTKVCRRCTGEGQIMDNWDRLQECPYCRGQGRVRKGSNL